MSGDQGSGGRGVGSLVTGGPGSGDRESCRVHSPGSLVTRSLVTESLVTRESGDRESGDPESGLFYHQLDVSSGLAGWDGPPLGSWLAVGLA